MKNLDSINTELILREKLAIQRTILANQTTFLAFLRTSMYFLVAGLSIHNFIKIEIGVFIETLFYLISIIIFILGILNYLRQKKIIRKSFMHIGRYNSEFEREQKR